MALGSLSVGLGRKGLDVGGVEHGAGCAQVGQRHVCLVLRLSLADGLVLAQCLRLFLAVLDGDGVVHIDGNVLAQGRRGRAHSRARLEASW